MRRKTFLGIVFTAMLMGFAQKANAVVSAGEYYLYNNFFGKLLSDDGGTPKLCNYSSTNDDAFIFVAETSSTSGYVMLKQKSSGKYLTASTSNSYSVLLSAKGTGDQYLWSLEQNFSTNIRSKKNTGARLGCDYVTTATVGVYYDKGASGMNWYAIIPANGSGFDASRTAAKTAVFTGEYGVQVQEDYQVDEAVEVDGIDYHIISGTPFKTGGSVNLKNEHSWLVFENNRPSNVKGSWLKYVKINGAAAVAGTNCRVEIWLKGAVVIPLASATPKPFIGTTPNGTFELGIGNTDNLGANSNEVTSFTLKRGYMATVFTGTNRSGYSRVYVADHADLTVNVSSINALKGRISSVWVRNWHYSSKCGYASTTGDIQSRTKQIGGSWFWNWDANYSSSDDLEYVPIKQHKYWPDNGNFWNNSITSMMLFNEPEHSEQHNNCDCGGTIGEWDAYTQTPQFNQYGVRIGSPSATDISWINNYVKHCSDMAQRCDFVCTHGYWSTDWQEKLNWVTSLGYPVWITEWKYGASWISSYSPSSNDEYAGKVLSCLDMMEYNDNVEHYAYYDADTGGSNGWMTTVFWDATPSKGVNPCGSVIERVKPHFGYKANKQPVPNWWAPAFENIEITGTKIQDGKYSLTVNNPNKDAVKDLSVLRMTDAGQWETVYTLTDRSLLESSTVVLENIPGLTAEDMIKVSVSSPYDNTVSKEALGYSTLENLRNLRFDEGANVTANITIAGSNEMKDVTGWAKHDKFSDKYEYLSGGQIAWGSGKTLAGSALPSKNSEGTATGGALGVVAAWSNGAVYEQNVILTPGEYTLTIPVYNAAGTTALTKNYIGFIADDGTEHLAKTTQYAVGKWTTETITFTIVETIQGRLSLGYRANNTGSGSQQRLFIDYVDIQRRDFVQDFSTVGSMENLTFNFGTFTDKSVLTYAKDIKNASTEVSQMQAVDNWNIVTNGDAHAAAQMKWGTSLKFAGQAVPAKNSDGTTYGGGLAICAVWGAKTQYTQPLTLPMGAYTITIPYYNVSGSKAVNGNYFGFRATDGSKVDGNNTFCYSSVKTFATGKWATMSITFTLTQDTEGELSLGYEAANSGAADMPHLFIDYVKIEETENGHVWPTKGDANFDGKLSIKDAPALVRMQLDSKTAHNEVVDVNEDGQVNANDMSPLVDKLLGK